MTVYALINKEVIPYVCKCKKVTNDFIYEKTKLDLNSIEKWLDVSDSSLPTILQAKKIAKCLHIPFAGLYMNTDDINVKSIPSIINNRTFNGSLSIDDSGFNIAVCDVLQHNVRRIVTEHPKMISFSGGKGSSSGDAFLIATALKYKLIIITEENKEKQNKIPQICKDYGIQTVSLTDLCICEGWVF